jgi:drug/metabolite transporter (DMT)-like permease
MNTLSRARAGASPGLVIAAFAAVYLIWGSTYLAIRFAIETVPPFVMGGARFLLAGLILYGWLRAKGTPTPAPFHWGNAAIIGSLLLGIGNGAVCWAERKVPSSTSALLIAITPLWFALLDWARPNGVRPHFQTLLGIVIGFGGMALLVGSREALRHNSIDPAGAAALMLASVAWASGSLYARYTPKPDSQLMGVALQMILGGSLLLLFGIVAGETGGFDVAKISIRSAMAFVYLIVIGSLVGFTAYSWLLKASTPAHVSTYAYVNPVIAVFLGWALGGETLTLRILWTAAVIVLGVVIITTRRTSLNGGDEKSLAPDPVHSVRVSDRNEKS